MRTNHRGRGGGEQTSEDACATWWERRGSVCVAGVCPGAAERGSATEHAQVGPGADAHAARASLPATPRPHSGAGERPGAGRAPPHAALPPAADAVRVGGDAQSSGPPGRCLGPGFFVRRKARLSGSGSTRRHFLARSRHRLARSLPPDWD